MTEKEALKHNPIFEDQPESVLDRFLGLAQKETYPAENIFYMDQSEYDKIHCVLDGTITVDMILTQEAGVPVKLESGDLFGLEALIQVGTPVMNSTLRAETEVTVLTWKVLDWQTICEQDPAVGYAVVLNIARLLHQRIRHWQISLLDNMSWGIE